MKSFNFQPGVKAQLLLILLLALAVLLAASCSPPSGSVVNDNRVGGPPPEKIELKSPGEAAVVLKNAAVKYQLAEKSFSDAKAAFGELEKQPNQPEKLASAVNNVTTGTNLVNAASVNVASVNTANLVAAAPPDCTQPNPEEPSIFKCPKNENITIEITRTNTTLGMAFAFFWRKQQTTINKDSGIIQDDKLPFKVDQDTGFIKTLNLTYDFNGPSGGIYDIFVRDANNTLLFADTKVQPAVQMEPETATYAFILKEN